MFKISCNKSLNGNRGLQKFCKILLAEMSEKFGVRIVDNRSDIHLCIIRNEPKPGAKILLRIDGVYYDKKRIGMNRPIARSISTADGVIYQSKWSQTLAEKMLKTKARKSAVAWNAVKQSQIPNKRPNEFGFDKMFICCSHWRVNKRLKSIVNSFIKFNSEFDLNYGLLVAGDHDYFVDNSNVKFIGISNNLWNLYSQSDYMCHICHLDSCPNTVVAALSAGLPVLCNNICGTHELVGADGVILNIDKSFNFNTIGNIKDVGSHIVNNNVIIEGMKQIASREWKVNRPDLDVSQSAKKYYDFCMEILS